MDMADGGQHTQSLETHLQTGSDLYDSDPKGALAAYYQAVSIEPSHVEGWNQIGRLMFDMQQYAEAEMVFRRVRKLSEEQNLPDWAEMAAQNVELTRQIIADEAQEDEAQEDGAEHAGNVDPQGPDENLTDAGEEDSLQVAAASEGDESKSIADISGIAAVTEKINTGEQVSPVDSVPVETVDPSPAPAVESETGTDEIYSSAEMPEMNAETGDAPSPQLSPRTDVPVETVQPDFPPHVTPAQASPESALPEVATQSQGISTPPPQAGVVSAPELPSASLSERLAETTTPPVQPPPAAQVTGGGQGLPPVTSAAPPLPPVYDGGQIPVQNAGPGQVAASTMPPATGLPQPPAANGAPAMPPVASAPGQPLPVAPSSDDGVKAHKTGSSKIALMITGVVAATGIGIGAAHYLNGGGLLNRLVPLIKSEDKLTAGSVAKAPDMPARPVIPSPAEAGRDQAFKIGMSHLVKGEYDKARAYLEQAEKMGHAEAGYNLASLYAKGDGVEKNFEKAVAYLRKSAEGGYYPSMTNLGLLYARGQGVEQNYLTARSWWLKAAAGEHPDAMHNLAVIYATGKGVDKDMKEAVKWYRKAANAGYVDSIANLGLIYANGDGVERDFEEARRLWETAAAKGHKVAAQNLEKLKKIMAQQ